MKKLYKAAKNFIKNLNGEVTFDTVVDYLQKSGYTIIYYSSDECTLLIKKYNLIDYQKSVNAFTYICDCANIVFINDKISLHDMLCSILHEASHIYLGHLLSNPYATDNRKNEMEAEALAYAILNYKKSYKPHLITIAMLVILMAFTHQCLNQSADSVTTSSATYISADKVVYLTPSGSKYHDINCKYTKDKNCTAVSKTEAEKCFSPCSVCNP